MIPLFVRNYKSFVKKKKKKTQRNHRAEYPKRLISLLGFRGNTLIQMFLNSSISYIQYHFLIYYGKILKRILYPN